MGIYIANEEERKQPILKNLKKEEDRHENEGCFLFETQQILKEIFEDLLEKEVSFEADFFDLGGDSLSGTLLLTRINKRFNVKLKLEHILELQSIAKISEYVQTKVAPEKNNKSITI